MPCWLSPQELSSRVHPKMNGTHVGTAASARFGRTPADLFRASGRRHFRASQRQETVSQCCRAGIDKSCQHLAQALNRILLSIDDGTVLDTARKSRHR